jgi:ATP-binding cassette subfamily C protein
MKLIRSAGAAGRHIAEFDRAAGELRDAYVSLSASPSVVHWWFSLGTATILAVVAYVALQLFGMPGTELAVLLIVFWRLSPRLTSLQVSYHTVLGGLPAWEAVARLAADLTSSNARAGAVPAFEYRRSVDLVDLGFAYIAGEPVVAGVTLSIPAGQTVAIVGPSGAGKSTIADLVLGLVPPVSGRILIDGLALTPERLPAWSEQVAYVPQDPFLFHDTVRANLLWAAPSASETEMWNALKASAADFVTRLPGGLDTVVGDRGVLLSGGERQRIALARALLRQPRLLVLDEATSSLDAENEELIRTAIDRLHGRTAILVISHRLSTVRNADVIHVLEQGRVIESGGWDELCLRPGGRFRALQRAQQTDDAALGTAADVPRTG